MAQHVQFVSSSQCLVQWCAVSPLEGAASTVCKHQLVSSVSACWHFVFWNLLLTIRTQRQCSWCLPAGLPAGAQHRRCHRTPAAAAIVLTLCTHEDLLIRWAHARVYMLRAGQITARSHPLVLRPVNRSAQQLTFKCPARHAYSSLVVLYNIKYWHEESNLWRILNKIEGTSDFDSALKNQVSSWINSSIVYIIGQ